MSDTINLYSVTSLLKLGLGTSDALVNWAVRTTAEAAYDKPTILQAFRDEDDKAGAIKWLADQRYQSSGKAAARGTDLHKAAEQLALGQEPEVEEPILPYVEQYRRFLDTFEPEFLMSEAPVYAPSYGYAGTCDGVMVIDGRRLLFDIKTTSYGPNSGKSRPPYPETSLQCVAYRRAELVGVLSEQRYASGRRYYQFNPGASHEPMPETDGAVVIVISPEDFQMVPLRTDDEVWRCWRHVMESGQADQGWPAIVDSRSRAFSIVGTG